jgi:DNA replication initiation complex subunit (GINS family)
LGSGQNQTQTQTQNQTPEQMVAQTLHRMYDGTHTNRLAVSIMPLISNAVPAEVYAKNVVTQSTNAVNVLNQAANAVNVLNQAANANEVVLTVWYPLLLVVCRLYIQCQCVHMDVHLRNILVEPVPININTNTNVLEPYRRNVATIIDFGQIQYVSATNDTPTVNSNASNNSTNSNNKKRKFWDPFEYVPFGAEDGRPVLSHRGPMDLLNLMYFVMDTNRKNKAKAMRDILTSVWVEYNRRYVPPRKQHSWLRLATKTMCEKTQALTDLFDDLYQSIQVNPDNIRLQRSTIEQYQRNGLLFNTATEQLTSVRWPANTNKDTDTDTSVEEDTTLLLTPEKKWPSPIKPTL